MFPGTQGRGPFLGNAKVAVSFEFFPPNSAEMEGALWRSIRRLEPLNPTNVSVTYGAGGSTRDRTHATVKRLLIETALKPAAHLTCVSATCEEVNRILQDYWELGVRHIVALRGDPPGGPGRRYEPTPGGFADSIELVKGIKEIAPFDVSVAAHPEKHPDSPSFDADLDRLKAKIDAGASSAATQFFFDNDVFFRYLDRIRGRGISIPVVPGILPIHNFVRMARFACKSGVTVPDWLWHRFDGIEGDQQTRRLAAATIAAEQVLGLADQGITQFHFYTLNRADLIYAICHMLGLRPSPADATTLTSHDASVSGRDRDVIKFPRMRPQYLEEG